MDRDSTIQLEVNSISGTTTKKTRNINRFDKIFQQIDLVIRKNFKKYKLEPEQFHPIKIEGKVWIF